MPAPKLQQLGEARAMYVGGVSIQIVAKNLGISQSTVYRWRLVERQAGLSWDALRGKMGGGGARALILGLEALLSELILNGTLAPDVKARALAEVHGVLEGERRHQAEGAGLGRFAGWASRELPPAEARAIVDAVAEYSSQSRSGVA